MHCIAHSSDIGTTVQQTETTQSYKEQDLLVGSVISPTICSPSWTISRSNENAFTAAQFHQEIHLLWNVRMKLESLLHLSVCRLCFIQPEEGTPSQSHTSINQKKSPHLFVGATQEVRVLLAQLVVVFRVSFQHKLGQLYTSTNTMHLLEGVR